jgi:ribosomal protein L27
MAHKKGASSSRNGATRRTTTRRQAFGGQSVHAGEILVRQRRKFHPGECRPRGDDTLFALVRGVQFGESRGRKTVSIVPSGV